MRVCINIVFMLKHLFTSNTRVKLLTLFLTRPDEEFFVRELTRTLDEQINSVRRELENLKKMGLLKSRSRNRRKFFTVNKKFLLFRELQSIILKAGGENEKLVKALNKIGSVDYLLITGRFLKKESPVDLLLVGKVPEEALFKLLGSLSPDEPLRPMLLSNDDFNVRTKFGDPVLLSLMNDPENVVLVNQFLIEEE